MKKFKFVLVCPLFCFTSLIAVYQMCQWAENIYSRNHLAAPLFLRCGTMRDKQIWLMTFCLICRRNCYTACALVIPVRDLTVDVLLKHCKYFFNAQITERLRGVQCDLLASYQPCWQKPDRVNVLDLCFSTAVPQTAGQNNNECKWLSTAIVSSCINRKITNPLRTRVNKGN